jgi:hypothetical protein
VVGCVYVLVAGLFVIGLDNSPLELVKLLVVCFFNSDFLKLISIDRQSGKSNSVAYSWADGSAKLIGTLWSAVFPTKLSLGLEDEVTLVPIVSAKLKETLWSTILSTAVSLTSTAATG